jgi:hypothetical protein
MLQATFHRQTQQLSQPSIACPVISGAATGAFYAVVLTANNPAADALHSPITRATRIPLQPDMLT